MKQNATAYACHVFVCVNDRKGARQSCADGRTPDLKETLKKAVTDRGWKPRVRISDCGCLGLCADGPNVILYPQGIWFSAVQTSDADRILAEIGRALGEA
jgi:(2Fe-2S) ferredoxin